MRIDMHCHTREGSIDAKVGVEEYIQRLIEMGFDGMLITDHNSYKGFEYWKTMEKSVNLPRPFVVLKGIEYDTRNGGHIIVILPEHINGASAMKAGLIGIRGMSVARLERIVHSIGGILGPAHPYDTGYYAFMNTRFGKRHPEFLDKFDFIETFNSCAKHQANLCALELSERLDKPGIAGSDTHRPEVIGTAWTDFAQDIHDNDDLIAAITGKTRPAVPHDALVNMHRNKNILMEKLGILGYWIYNRITLIKRFRIR